MSLLVTNTISRISHSANLTVCVNKFHTSFAIYLNQGWRHNKGLTRNPNKTGPLITLPDYSFKDHRPTAYGSRQLNRIKRHQGYMKRIIQLVGEVDHAVERHAKLMKDKEEHNKQILDSKLKPKGQQVIDSE